MKTIAGEHSLQACVSPALEPKFIDHLDQSEESDLNLLERLARDRDAVVKPQMGKLAFKQRGDGKSCSGVPLIPAVIRKRQMMKPRFTYRARPANDGSKASYSDHGKASRELGSTGDRNQSGAGAYQLRGTWPTKAEAEEVAAATDRQQQRLERSGTFAVEGRPDVFAEGPVLLTSCRVGIDGLWIIKSARHRFDAAGYMINLSVEPPRRETSSPSD